MDLKPASKRLIREHYVSRACETRITKDGSVRFRSVNRNRRGPHNWLDGGYVEDYHVDERGNVHLI